MKEGGKESGTNYDVSHANTLKIENQGSKDGDIELQMSNILQEQENDKTNFINSSTD